MQLLRTVFRLLLVAFSVLFPMPSYPVQYYAVGTVQEYTLPKGPEGIHDPAVAYWQHSVQAAETWLADAKRGLYRAECDESDILLSSRDGGNGSSSWGWRSGRDLVIFKELSGKLDPQSFNARDWFADWPSAPIAASARREGLDLPYGPGALQGLRRLVQLHQDVEACRNGLRRHVR